VDEIATIRRPLFRGGRRFAIHGADGSRWAAGTDVSICRTRGSGPLVVLRDNRVLLRDGPILNHVRDGGDITVTDVLGRRMAMMAGPLFTASHPVLTLLQAIGLAHLLRRSARVLVHQKTEP